MEDFGDLIERPAVRKAPKPKKLRKNRLSRSRRAPPAPDCPGLGQSQPLKGWFGLVLFGIFLAIVGLIIMSHANKERTNEDISHASKAIEMITNWPKRNSNGDLLLPWMDTNWRGLRPVCEHGGIYLGHEKVQWPWFDHAGNWKWPWK